MVKEAMKGVIISCAVLVGLCFVNASAFDRSSFPRGFLFGTTSAAVQYEGAAFEGGKGPSIWDHFARQFPAKMFNKSTPDVADDFYHLYKEDVKLMEFLGFNAFRFSISWSRILPRGKLNSGVNKEGVAFYNNLINELLSKGIQPLVTMYHWDMPQALDDEYGGFLSPRSVDDYLDFAELCFKEFGDRVKHWMTFNEPYVIARYGYDLGLFAPGRCSPWVSPACPAGDSATEPYIVGHHVLLAHAAAVKLYRQKYKETQKGEIGLNLVCHWFVPYSNSKEDLSARQRALDFMVGWTLHPLTYGDYPYSMRRYVKHRLPEFSPQQKETLKASFDFIGLSYYTGKYAAYDPTLHNNTCLSSSTDSLVRVSLDRNGQYIGPQTGSPIYCIYPKGLTKVLSYISEKYKKPTIYVTENGIADVANTTLKESVNDPHRANFYQAHLLALQEALKKGVNVKGYLAWSFLDNFEWASAFSLRYGLVYVDFKDGLKRYPKNSALWFKNFLRNDQDSD